MKNPLRILLVDDNEADRMAVRQALSQANISIELFEAKDCSEATETLSSTSLDCVFLDYYLPDGNGLAFIQQIRQLNIRIPLIVLTAQKDESIAVELMKSGATDYLAKSKVSPDHLLNVLRNAIRVYQAEIQIELANRQLREKNNLLLHKNRELEIQQQQIELQNLKLIEASHLKSQFLTTISHELCAPLNAIIGFSQYLLRYTELLTPQQKGMIERILNNGKHLFLLLNEIISFSKLEIGRVEIYPEQFDIIQLLHSTAAEMRELADKKQLCLDVQIHLNQPQVFNDPKRLRQVLINLLSNAIKFTSSGQVRVEVFERLPDWIAIAVHDTGIGISQKDFDCIFEPFRQVDQSNTRQYAGTGLGLAIVKSLVHMMQGKITVESQLGQGSTFQIELPRQISRSNHLSEVSKYSVSNRSLSDRSISNQKL